MMDANVRAMLRSIIKYDIIIAIITVIGFFMIFKKADYDAVIILGLLVSMVNFIMNAYFSSYGMSNKKGQLFILAGAVIRIAFAAVVAVVLFKINKYYTIVFLAGYSLHYLAAVTYALSIKKKGSV